jgi:hypothetical protein
LQCKVILLYKVSEERAMSDATGTKDGPHTDNAAGTEPGEGTAMDEETAMDARSAAAIMADADERARRELTPNALAIFAGWGLVFLLCNGIIWLAVHSQRPYTGPPGWTLGLVAVLAISFLTGYAAILNRAARGVGGVTARSRRTVYLSVAAGLAAVFAIEGGLRSSGASIGTTDLVGASGPILVYGLVCAGSAFAWRKRDMFALGLWLIAVAVGSVFAGAATAWGIDALAPAVGIVVALAVRRGQLGARGELSRS